jgi:hypothetical protein
MAQRFHASAGNWRRFSQGNIPTIHFYRGERRKSAQGSLSGKRGMERGNLCTLRERGEPQKATTK